MEKLIEELRANANGHPLDVYASIMNEAADALESQAREIERMTEKADNWDKWCAKARPVKTQPSGVALPERLAFEAWFELRGVWPALNYEEIFVAGMRSSRTAFVFLPERKEMLDRMPMPVIGPDRFDSGWNACLDEVARLNQPASGGEYGDAYQGAREDLAIWKRRALEAETKVREQDQIIDHLTLEAQGEVRFGEPVISSDWVDERAAFEAAYLIKTGNRAGSFDEAEGAYVSPELHEKY